jgi:hypothetical protein
LECPSAGVRVPIDHGKVEMRAKMSKMMLGALATAGMAAALALSLTTGPAGAVPGSADLAQAMTGDDVVLVQGPPPGKDPRKKGKSKKRSSKPKLPRISEEHKQKIRQNVPAEFHQYIPGMGGGGAR